MVTGKISIYRISTCCDGGPGDVEAVGRGDDPLGVDQSAAAEEVVRGSVLQPEERHPGVLAHLQTVPSSVHGYNVCRSSLTSAFSPPTTLVTLMPHSMHR